MNVLITGGTGFIGSRLALRYLDQNDRVRVLGQINTPAEADNQRLLESHGAELVLGSVTDKDKVRTAVTGIDVVFHLAAAQHEANVPDQHFRDVNVTGTENMLEASAAAGVKRFVHGSTIGVYGSAMNGEINENTPLRPDNIYGITKCEGEALARSYQDRLPVVIVRISETYGPGDRRLLKLFKTIQKNVFFMMGDGKNLHHLIYVDDLLDGLMLCATHEQAVGQTFVLAGKQSVTTSEMVQTIAEELHAKTLPFHVPLTLLYPAATLVEAVAKPLGIQPPIHRRRLDFFKKTFVFSHHQASKLLGFAPSHSFRDGVRKTAKWYTQMGLLSQTNGYGSMAVDDDSTPLPSVPPPTIKLTARIEPFDSFWEGPEDIEKGYRTFGLFYRDNYLKYIPPEKDANILVVSCGPGYFVNVLVEEGYRNVLGLDSDARKIRAALKKNLNCRAEHAVDFLASTTETFDVIICEQELNHLTKDEIVMFLKLCWDRMPAEGTLVVHGLNGANPMTGAEALAQNFDHFNTFTEYTLRQVLGYCGFGETQILPLNLYVFTSNPFNYVAKAVADLYTLWFRLTFKLYGKFNRVFTKKIGAVCKKKLTPQSVHG
jgi:nucleoside-diphosphate-sugar epimerase/SAM-dependent methyltransferase